MIRLHVRLPRMAVQFNEKLFPIVQFSHLHCRLGLQSMQIANLPAAGQMGSSPDSFRAKISIVIPGDGRSQRAEAGGGIIGITLRCVSPANITHTFIYLIPHNFLLPHLLLLLLLRRSHLVLIVPTIQLIDTLFNFESLIIIICALQLMAVGDSLQSHTQPHPRSCGYQTAATASSGVRRGFRSIE